MPQRAPDLADLTDLMTALLDGAFEAPLWTGFLDRLRAATRADFAILVFQPPGWPFDEALQLLSGEGSIAESKALYRQHFERDSPFKREHAIEGHPHTLAEILARDGGAHAAFFATLTGPLGITAIREMRIQEASGVDAWLTIARRGGDFGAADAALLTALAPLLRGVLRLFVARERERLAASLASEAVGRLQFGWIALGADDTVLDADSFGETVLARSGVLLRGPKGQLTARPAALGREVSAAIASVGAAMPGRPRAVSLCAEPWLDMLLVPAKPNSFVTSASPSVIAYVHGDNWHSAERCAQLMDLFSLTTSEARLALALCRGKTIAEAAADLGLTVATSRSYSKTIYAKTGARGLPDLVRILMGSVLALAGGG